MGVEARTRIGSARADYSALAMCAAERVEWKEEGFVRESGVRARRGSRAWAAGGVGCVWRLCVLVGDVVLGVCARGGLLARMDAAAVGGIDL